MKGLLVLSTSLILIALTGASPSEGKVTLQAYEQLADAEDVKKKKKKGKKILKKIGDLLSKHIVEERVEREELAEKVKFYEKEFNVNPLSWGKRKKK